MLFILWNFFHAIEIFLSRDGASCLHADPVGGGSSRYFVTPGRNERILMMRWGGRERGVGGGG